MGSLATDFSDKTVFVIENIKIPDYCSLFKLGFSKTETQSGMWSDTGALSSTEVLVLSPLLTQWQSPVMLGYSVHGLIARLCGGE